METTELFRRIQLYRLTYDLDVVQKKINENKMSAVSAADGFFTRLGAGVMNNVKSQRLKKLVALEQVIQKQIATFRGAYPAVVSLSDNEIKEIAVEIWSNSNQDMLLKTLFSLTVVLDTEYDYEYADDGLAALSIPLWGNPETMNKIKSEYRSVYTDIAKKPFSTAQKWMMGGIAALVLLTPVLAPVALSGASASAITGGLAGIGGTMVGGIGVFAVAEMALDGLAIAATYGVLDASNKAKVRNEFRNMDFNASAEMLAMKAYSLSVAKRLDGSEDFKERVNNILQMIQDLKGDTDYVLYVEKQNIAENKKKIQLFHNFDVKLAQIVGV